MKYILMRGVLFKFTGKYKGRKGRADWERTELEYIVLHGKSLVITS